MFQGIGTWEILLIFLVALLLFGAKRIPEIARGLGKGINEFKHAVKDVQDEIETSTKETPPSDPPPNTTAQSTRTESTEASSDAERKVES